MKNKYEETTEILQEELDKWVDEQWGSDRARGFVSWYAHKLMLGVNIIDKNGKLDKDPRICNDYMKRDMRDAAENLTFFMSKYIAAEPTTIGAAGNSILIEYWDAI